ncbi:MAG: hypothetical protein HYY05_01495 [Chloroflexi bacterium]|nr:hypothetical protein [Chloroflexota bacterium]
MRQTETIGGVGFAADGSLAYLCWECAENRTRERTSDLGSAGEERLPANRLFDTLVRQMLRRKLAERRN